LKWKGEDEIGEALEKSGNEVWGSDLKWRRTAVIGTATDKMGAV